MKKNRLIIKLQELIKYGFAGAVSTFSNLLFFWLLERMGIYYVLANVISYGIAVIINYVLNKLFVFERKQKEEGKRFARFLLIRIGNLAVDNLLFYLCVSIFNFSLYGSRLALTTIEILITYSLVKKVVFK